MAVGKKQTTIDSLGATRPETIWQPSRNLTLSARMPSDQDAPLKIYLDHLAYPARLSSHDNRSIRQLDRLIDVVRHQDNCFSLLLPDLEQEVLHDGTSQ